MTAQGMRLCRNAPTPQARTVVCTLIRRPPSAAASASSRSGVRKRTCMDPAERRHRRTPLKTTTKTNSAQIILRVSLKRRRMIGGDPQTLFLSGSRTGAARKRGMTRGHKKNTCEQAAS
jgi:hypothetical protein